MKTLLEFAGAIVRADSILAISSVYVEANSGCWAFQILLQGGHQLIHNGGVGEPEEKTYEERAKVVDAWRRNC